MKKRHFILSIFLILIPLIHCALAAPPASHVPDGFVDIEEVIPSIVLDIRYYTPHNFVGRPIKGYLASKCYLTKEAASALKKVQEELRKFSLSLKVYDCYRPQRAVDHFVEWAKEISDKKMKKEFYPTVNKENLFRDGFIASRSGHSRGSTVDLTIVPIPCQGKGPMLMVSNYASAICLREKDSRITALTWAQATTASVKYHGPTQIR